MTLGGVHCIHNNKYCKTKLYVWRTTNFFNRRQQYTGFKVALLVHTRSVGGPTGEIGSP